MYRFSIEKEDWILRFSPNLQIERETKKAIVNFIMQIGKDLSSYSHGESFVIFSESEGVIVFNIEKVPSFILTVSSAVPKDKWYVQNGSTVSAYK